MYSSDQNVQRADRGRDLIATHPDFGRIADNERDDMYFAASDTVADILHALNEADLLGGMFQNNPTTAGAHAFQFLTRVLTAFEGDFEDELT